MNGSFVTPEKKFNINFTKANTKFSLSLHYNSDNSYLFVDGKEISKFKADNKNVNPLSFVSEVYLMDLVLSLNRNVYDFSVDYNSIDKSDILNIQKYLMTKNNIK